ncbi:MAG: hypothetical protein FJ098_10135 [Deltaproteobacteria bacterium]|nr:hypothetical protein [Deltaproteobacteria bacterium]
MRLLVMAPVLVLVLSSPSSWMGFPPAGGLAAVTAATPRGPGGDGPPPASAEDEALVARAEKAAAACGLVSRATLPPGWDMTLYGNGCALWAPPSWQRKAGPGTLEVAVDTSRKAGYFVVTSWIPGEHWTDETLAAHMLEQLRVEHPDMRPVRTKVDTSLAALGATTRQTHVRFTHGGVPTLGEFRVVYTGCAAMSGMCPLTVMGMWAPEAELSQALCTLLQIDASIRCPTGGGASSCSDADCDASCRAEGRDGGACSGDDCVCR